MLLDVRPASQWDATNPMLDAYPQTRTSVPTLGFTKSGASAALREVFDPRRSGRALLDPLSALRAPAAGGGDHGHDDEAGHQQADAGADAERVEHRQQQHEEKRRAPDARNVGPAA